MDTHAALCSRACMAHRRPLYSHSAWSLAGVTSGYDPTFTGSPRLFVGKHQSYFQGPAGCRNCTAGFYFDSNADLCLPCEAGTFTNSDVTSVCSSCKAGGYSDPGAIACTDCVAGKSSTNIGAATELECIKCDAGKSSDPGSTSCYASCDFLEVLVGGACEPCKVGAVCDSDGRKVETMALSPTFRRTSNASNDILKCPNEAACTPPTNSTSICATGHGGPFCELCEDNYSLSAGDCVSCESGGANITSLVVMALLVVQYFHVRAARTALHITHFLTHTMCRSSA